MQQINFPSEQAKKIVEVIKHQVSPCTVFIWGYRTVNSGTHHFDLVVFSNTVASGSGANIANTIKEQSGGSITASVLVHKLTDLATKQPNQQRFFDNILRNGQRLSLDKNNPPYADTIPPRDEEGLMAELRSISLVQHPCCRRKPLHRCRVMQNSFAKHRLRPISFRLN